MKTILSVFVVIFTSSFAFANDAQLITNILQNNLGQRNGKTQSSTSCVVIGHAPGEISSDKAVWLETDVNASVVLAPFPDTDFGYKWELDQKNNTIRLILSDSGDDVVIMKYDISSLKFKSIARTTNGDPSEPCQIAD